MPYFLEKRDTESRELMDKPDCDRQKLFNTYHYFKYVNRLLSGWRVIYRQYMRPILSERGGSATLLDIGFGGGDIPVDLVKWALQDGFSLRITAIDTDSKAMEYSQQQNYHPNITFRNTHTSTMVKEGKQFDFVISNHLLHHLTNLELKTITQHARQLSRCSVLMNDIQRSDMAYALFYLATRFIPNNSFIHIDGLLSIRRSFTQNELSQQLPQTWSVDKPYPFRLLACYKHNH